MSDVIEQVYEEAPTAVALSAPQQLITIDPARYVDLVFEPFAKRLADAKALALTTTYDVKTTAGMATAVKIRATFRDIRVESEKARKVRKAPILEIGKLLDSRQKEIEAEIEPLESAPDVAIKAEEVRKEAAKAEAARIEAERQAAIQTMIDGIKYAPVRAAGKSSEEIATLKDAISETVIDHDTYGTRAGDAMMARSQATAALTEMFDAAVAAEQAAAEAKRQAEADRVERERVAEANRAESARLAALAADIARKEQEARERQEAERAEQEARDRAERGRLKVIRERIEFLGDFVRAAVGMSSAKVAAMIETLDAEEITADAYAEFMDEAETVKVSGLKKMWGMLAAQRALEAEAARQLAAQAKINRQQAELQRQQEAADNLARINRETQERLELERKLEADHAEALIENARVDAERAEQQRLQAEAEEQARRKRVDFITNGPGDAEIAKTLATHYDVEIGDAMEWLKKFDYDAADRHFAANNMERAA